MAARIMGSVHDSAAIVFTSEPTAYLEWGEGVGNERMGTTRGPVPADVLPKEFRITKSKKVCDYNSGLVSTRLKAAIESMEPGVHQFHPVTILNKDSTPYQEPFWLMKICQNIDAILPTTGVERLTYTPFPGAKPGQDWSWRLVAPFNNGDLAVSSSVIKGRAIWTDLRMSYIDIFVSNALRDMYARDGMTGWDERDVWREE